MSIGIYKITSPNGKVYIGQSINIKRREDHYRILDKNCIGPKIYNSLKFYGWEQHKFELIEECNLEQLDEKETYWKQYYLNLYGWSKMLFCELYDKSGGPRSKNTIEKMKNSMIGKNNRIILQYDLQNTFIKKWHSIREAEDIYGKAIKSVLEGKIYTAGGYIWRYENDPLPSDYKIPTHGLSKCVNQYDLEGNFIKEWKSIAEINKELGYPTSNISLVCNGKQKTAYGFKWSYK